MPGSHTSFHSWRARMPMNTVDTWSQEGETDETAGVGRSFARRFVEINRQLRGVDRPPELDEPLETMHNLLDDFEAALNSQMAGPFSPNSELARALSMLLTVIA